MENTPRCRCRNASRTVTNPRLSPRESVSLKRLCGDCPHGVRTGKLRSKEKSASIHCFSQFLSSTFFRLSHRDLAACGEIDGTRAITVPCDKSQEEAQIGQGSMEEAHHLNHRSHACIILYRGAWFSYVPGMFRCWRHGPEQRPVSLAGVRGLTVEKGSHRQMKPCMMECQGM